MFNWIIDQLTSYFSNIDWVDIVGYIASLLVATTFYMKTIIPLRIFAICSNIFFITYGFFSGAPPVFVLHIFLFPLNIVRLTQMKKLIKDVKSASQGSYSLESLVPYMKRQKFLKDEILFEKGSAADKMYLIEKGKILLEEINRTVKSGDLIGEIGIFSPYKERTATAKCMEDGEILAIDETKITQLYYQNPTFGYYLIQLVIKRFIENFDKEQLKRLMDEYE